MPPPLSYPSTIPPYYIIHAIFAGQNRRKVVRPPFFLKKHNFMILASSKKSFTYVDVHTEFTLPARILNEERCSGPLFKVEVPLLVVHDETALYPSLGAS